MPNVLGKLYWGQAIGVYFCGDRISVTDVGDTVKGLTMLDQQSFEIADQEPVQILMNTLQEYVKSHGGKNAPLCIGVKPEQTFFITSGAEYGEQEHLCNKLLEHAGFHNPEERGGIVADYYKVNKVKSSAGQLWSIGICKKQLAKGLYAAFDQAGFKDILLQPTPWSMSNFSIKLPRKNKHWKVFIQVFFNETEGLVILVVEKNPMCWKRFSFLHLEPVEKMELAIKSILMQSAITLSRPVVDGIILQGPDAEKLNKRLNDDLGIEVVVADGAGYTDSQCSYSLAMSAKSKKGYLFDLFRELRPKPSIMQIFPWKLAAMIVFMAGCMAFMMWQKASKFAGNYNILKKQDLSYGWTNNKQTADIANERKALLAEIQAVGKFLSSRIIWSDYLRDLPTRLPPNVNLENISATCEFKEDGKNTEGQKLKRSLSFRGITLFDKGRASPEEVAVFMESLKKVELFQRDFPQVQLVEIRWRCQGNQETAMFTVLALPEKTEKSGKEKDEKIAKDGSEG